MSESASHSFDLLDRRIQHWIWTAQWTELHAVQEQAIPAILRADHDVIIAAQTAAGKTEAAFFPILTHMLTRMQETREPGLCLYVSPLKALINDQFGRLEQLCATLDLAVWPWHGDISSSQKKRFFKQPNGILQITPESLEAMLCNRGFQVPVLFAQLQYLVIDELHAFIGTERGKQLQSLLHRIDIAINKKVPRIGLSATLGDMRLAANFLRPPAGAGVEIIQAAPGEGHIRLQLKAYLDLAPGPTPKPNATPGTPADYDDDEPDESTSASETSITAHLFATLRGSNNLIFPNSRARVEQYTWRLQRLCEAAHIANEFWPHHGSLSREIREETEAALKNKERHASAICTNTLELGIDIGAVKSIAQIGSPPSVASLRQRLGRSGRRRGESAILRAYVIETELNSRSHLMDQLRESLFELSAMISLLLEHWFEPPKTDGLHLSTLIQQLLSLIAQRGGASAMDAWRILCQSGPFDKVSKSDFLDLLRHLGRCELLQQDASGLLLHGAKGEPMVNHYTFYAAFATEEEFRVVTHNKTLGSLPISNALSVGDFILFAAKTWRVESIDEEGKTIFVTKTHSGRAPAFNGNRGHIHDCVRQRMFELYAASDTPVFLDATAARLLKEGRATYQRHALATQSLVPMGNNCLLFTWLGDRANAALAAMLKQRGFTAMPCGPAIEIMMPHVSASKILDCLSELAAAELPTAQTLLADARNLQQAKWDWALPDELLKKSFASLHLDIATAHQWLITNAGR
jgi:ATP-dependent helicase Lhr and Lhr-like helicase